MEESFASTPSFIGVLMLALFGIIGSILVILLCAKKQKDESNGVVTDGSQGTFEKRTGSHLEEVDGKAKSLNDKDEENNHRGGSTSSALIEMNRRHSSQMSEQSNSSHCSRKRNPGDTLPAVKPDRSPKREFVAIQLKPVVNNHGKELDRKSRSKTMPAREQRAPYDTSDGSDETYARVHDVPKPQENAYLVVDLKGKEEQYEIVDSELKRKRRAVSSPESEISAVVSQMNLQAPGVDPSLFNIGLQKTEVQQENSGGSGVYAIVSEDKEEEEKPRTISRLSIFKRSKKGTSSDKRAEKESKHQQQDGRSHSSGKMERPRIDSSSPPPPLPPLENLKHIAEEHRKSVHLYSMSDDENRSLKSFGSSPGTPVGSPRLDSCLGQERSPRPSVSSTGRHSYTPIDIPPLAEQDDGNHPYMVVTEELRAKSLERLDKAGIDKPSPVVKRRNKERILAEFELRGCRLMKRHSMPLLLDTLPDKLTDYSQVNVEDLYAKVDLKQKEQDRNMSELYSRVDKFQTGFKTFYPSKREKKVEQHYDGAYCVLRENSKSLPSPTTQRTRLHMKREVINDNATGRLVRLKSWGPYCTVDTQEPSELDLPLEDVYETIKNDAISK